MTNKEELLELIRTETGSYNNANTFHEKMERMNNIIQIKGSLISSGDLTTNELYQDVKRFLKDYTLSIDEGKYGYDSLDINPIIKYLDYFEQKEQIALAKYLMRILYLNGFEAEYEKIETYKNRIEINYCLSNKPYLHLIKILYLFTTFNIYTIGGTVLLIILGASFLFLPAPEWSSPIFNIDTLPLCKNVFLNNLLNFIGSILNVHDGFKINPLNSTGIIVLILGKLFIVIFVINILVKEFNNKIKF